jgi:hypothetical protein
MTHPRLLGAALAAILAAGCTSPANHTDGGGASGTGGGGSGGAGAGGGGGGSGGGATGQAGSGGPGGAAPAGAGGLGGTGGGAGPGGQGGGNGGGGAGGGGAGASGGGAGSGACVVGTDNVSTSCVAGVVTVRVSCPSSATVIGTCPFGCLRAGAFGQVGLDAICSATPDAGADDGGAQDGGTFVMCGDHADFNGRGRCAATGNVGAVFALQDRGAAATRTTLTAVFGTTTPPSETGCARAPVGAACTAVTCPRVGATRGGGAVAGVITAKSNGGALAVKPDATGVYDVAQLGRALWSLPKAALTFAAAGGAVPAFGETFCGPAAVAITKPAGAPGAGLTIDRATDLAVQWTPSAVGDLEVVLRDDSTSTTSSVEVQCFFPASSGQGTVPKAALAQIGPGAHAVASYLWVRKIGIGASGACVELTGITTNDSSAGAAAPFNGSALYQ